MNLIEQATCPIPEYRLIPLTQNQFAKVDAADYEWLNQWKWYADFNKCTQSFYAGRNITVGIKRQKRIKMHRFILGFSVGDGKIVDHINHDTLDNRRNNIREATSAQNARNSRRRRTNTSGFTGVQFWPRINKWSADITENYRREWQFFSTKEEAIAARKAIAQALHGEFASS